jgi:predicted enzyme related to lactoylglutathione lyase
MITEIAFTGTPVTDIKRAREFYEGVLGLKPAMESAGGMWVEYEIGNGTLGVGCYGEVWKPSPDGTCIAFEVDDLDAEIARREIFHGSHGHAGLPLRHHSRSRRQPDHDS